MVNASPIERRTGMTEAECLEFCQHMPTCQSAIYSVFLNICDLFNTNSSDGYNKLVKLTGYVYFEPIHGNKCAGSMYLHCSKLSFIYSDKRVNSAGAAPIFVNQQSSTRSQLITTTTRPVFVHKDQHQVYGDGMLALLQCPPSEIISVSRTHFLLGSMFS
jgi:hypothetical protein